uniref:Rap-GAP domain-containing protein n=1 Tax=Electrophorus electricus TaxID=8005 RepID=A0AAY5F2G0_ELEEL
MFTRRGYGDVKKSTQKVLDPKKDVLTRLKHLRSLLGESELKTFFETNCSQIYFIFYENFITLESNLKQRGNKSHREELDSILFIFEKILQLLPEKINSRWQFHSIGSILKKLLHTGNSFKIRCEGMRLFLLWLQALQTHCAEEQLLIFACLVPGFPAVPSSRGPCTLDTIIYNPFSNPPDAKIVPEEITPLVPAIPGEKISDDQTCYILQTVLKFMVVQVRCLEWHKKDNQDSGFRFLFSLFKKYYLPHLFPSFTKLTNLYKPLLDLPHHRPKPLYVQVSRNNESTFCTRDQYLAPRVAFITWLVNFFLEKKYMSTSASNAKNGGDVLPKLIQEKSSEPEPNGPAEQEKSHSNSSTLSDRHASNSSLCSVEEEHRSVYDMVHCILLSTPDNVNFVNEVFHQAFLLPSCEASATRKVIKVYRKWILQDRPAFMSEPDKTGQDEEDTGDDHQTTEADSTHAQVPCMHTPREDHHEQRCDVKAGMQATLQVFLTNSANVFLLEPCQDVPKLLENQVEVCRAVLSIYRRMIMEQTMNRQTWEQMLQVLLRITEAVMKRPQDDHRKDAFAQSLASVLFRTIIVAWVRANLSVFISRELWDELLAVLSSLSHWEELVHEWANIMDSLTMVLARCVYGLDLNNLPLDKLSEQKEKKQRGRGVMQDSQKAAAVARSFSLSWRNAGEQAAAQEPMRFRSATTTGAPAVEKARNNVRQKASAKRSQSISNCVHLCEALPATKSVPVLLHTVSSFLPGISHNSHCSHRLSGNLVSVTLVSFLNIPPFFFSFFFGLLALSSDPDICLLTPKLLFSLALSPSFFLSLCLSLSLPLSSPSLHALICFLFPVSLTDSSEFLADDISIIAGGCLTGWHADSAFVLWRRILGILGDVNNIRCPRIHAKVFSYLYELWHRLAKIRDNLGINIDNQSALPSALFIPPLRMLASWLFKATMLPADFKMGKLQAYRLICEMMTKHQDVLPNTDFLVHLYHVMRKGFTSDDQDVLNTMIRCCSPRFFFLGLPGFTMLVGDFISAAARVLSADSFEAPRIEAQTLLGSLVCFPNLYQQIPSLQAIPGIDIKVCFLVPWLRSGRRWTHPCLCCRCVAICSLGLWVCEELGQQRVHHQVKDAINVLGVTLKVSGAFCSLLQCKLHMCHFHMVVYCRAQPTASMISLLCVCVCVCLMVSLLLCLLDWCMSVPLSILLEPITMPVLDDPASQKAPLLDYIYRVLHCCVSGSNLHTQQSHYLLSLSDLSTDYDPFLPLSQVKSSEPAPSPGAAGDFGNLLTVAEGKNMELIPLTARMIMTHLVNHLGHHPLSGGPALLHSLVNENHDNPYVESSELSSEVFKSPNLQLFVFNDSTLVSYLQIPTEGPPTALSGLSPREHSSEVRVIVRDISGKYSWDCSVLYKTLEGTSVHCSSCREESLHQYAYQSSTPSKPGSSHASRCSSVVEVEDGIDVLDQLLENLGISSPECLPEPQLRLTQPAPPPMGMNHETEGAIMETIQRQAQQEGEELARRRSEDPSIRAAGQREPTHQEPKAPFYFCRLLLNELGMNSWDRRKSFHLLKKNSKLLRELKNLDSRQCRETHKIAVFYIGEGQEDKCSILSNTEGSQAYEEFVSGLGWEVDLATHCGFMGGLQRNGSTGTTAPYYSTSNVEVIFHVSTRMPSDSDDSVTKKLRHLGNDEVHIVWSEHTRDYRRGIIPTDFGDVLIIIYPMKNHTFFIQIMKKAQVPFFGPLFDGAIVTGVLLPSLVRATCINASRAVKSRLTLYQSFYEERALYLEAIILNHKENMTFEDFAAQVFSPSQSYYPTSGTGKRPPCLSRRSPAATPPSWLRPAPLGCFPVMLFVLFLSVSRPVWAWSTAAPF